MSQTFPKYFHLHMVSDATGETLTSIAKAAIAQYSEVEAVQHMHPLVRTRRQLSRVLSMIEEEPGIVLHTMVNQELVEELEQFCQDMNLPNIPILDPVLKVFGSYLGAPSAPRIGGQHSLDAEYFSRIDALNFSLTHDDGLLPENLDEADIVLVGISRTSKTPTSIYLANKGYKTTNFPLVPSLPLPPQMIKPTKALIVGLIASVERIEQVRRHRVADMAQDTVSNYVDHEEILKEISDSRRLYRKYNWPIIDVTRRSIEETAAAILKIYYDRKRAGEDH